MVKNSMGVRKSYISQGKTIFPSHNLNRIGDHGSRAGIVLLTDM